MPLQVIGTGTIPEMKQLDKDGTNTIRYELPMRCGMAVPFVGEEVQAPNAQRKGKFWIIWQRAKETYCHYDPRYRR